MAITAAMVKELREMSGAGMMDCKKALTEADGDMDKAVEVLREKGLAKAVKKSGRIAAEGIVTLKVTEDGKKAVAVEVNSETDFVAKNEKFQNYVSQVAEQALETEAADVEAFLAETWKFDSSKTVNEELAGQIAALKPQYTNRSEISADYIAHEEEILRAQIMNDPKESQKPEKVIEGMIKGRINKELKEICLMDQVYVKAEDGKQIVSKYIEQVAKENSAKITIKGFVRFETGEGLEKKNEDFAAEVAAQMGAM